MKSLSRIAACLLPLIGSEFLPASASADQSAPPPVSASTAAGSAALLAGSGSVYQNPVVVVSRGRRHRRYRSVRRVVYRGGHRRVIYVRRYY